MTTISTIRAKVSSEPRWAERAILALYERQTAQEQQAERTIVLNRMGFNAFDAEILTSFARQIGRGQHLSDKQLRIAYRALPKYAKQLERISREKMQPQMAVAA